MQGFDGEQAHWCWQSGNRIHVDLMSWLLRRLGVFTRVLCTMICMSRRHIYMSELVYWALCPFVENLKFMSSYRTTAKQNK